MQNLFYDLLKLCPVLKFAKFDTGHLPFRQTALHYNKAPKSDNILPGLRPDFHPDILLVNARGIFVSGDPTSTLKGF